MKYHKFTISIIFGLALITAAGCAADERTGKALADAAASGPVRAYAATQADTLAEISQVLRAQAAPTDGSAPDLDAARAAWLQARAAYDRGVAVDVVLAPALDFAIDGAFDDARATTGLRYVERALFETPPASAAELASLTASLADDAQALHAALSDGTQALLAADLLGSMAAIAGQMAGKLDGMVSPYAGASLLSIQSNLIGLQAMYGPLSGLVHNANAALDQQVLFLLSDLAAQTDGLSSVDAVSDKPALLRECAALATAFKQIGPALGLSVTNIDLS